MSDNRLGVNPLEWVAPAEQTPEPKVPVADATVQATEQATGSSTPATPPSGGIFLPPSPETEETSMSKDKAKIKIKQQLDTDQIVTHLKDLAQSLESGVIRAQDGDQTVTLSVPGQIEFEMKVSKKKNKAKCAIELEWHDDGCNTEGFKISDK